jgi:hypothetical protein
MPAADYDLFREYESFGGEQGHFQDFLEIYRESGASQVDADEDQNMFFEFLNAFTPDVESHDRDWWQEIRQEFYDLSGITYEDIDWEAYREAIGYGST